MTPYAFRWCGACARYHRAIAPAFKTCKELDAFGGDELDARYGKLGWMDNGEKHIPPAPEKRGPKPKKG